MIVSLSAFKGIFPRIAPELLPDGAALTAQNCKLTSGALVPLWATVAINAVIKSGTKSLWRFGIGDSDWLSWTHDTDIVRCPVPADAFSRIYFTTPPGGPEGGKPQLLNYYTDTVGTKNTSFLGSAAPTGSYHLGMPAPTNAPVLGLPTGGDATNPQSVAYAYTYVSRFGEESPPSPPSSIAARNVGASIPVTWSAPGGNYAGRSPVDSVNIYRTNTGSNSTEYLFVAQRPVGDTTWTDTVANAELQEILATTEWEPPPTGLAGLVNLPNGSLAGFEKNNCWFSEPYQPHAWPVAYRLSFPEIIVGLATLGMSVLVLTVGNAYLVSGNTPGSMGYEKLESSFSCVAKRSIVDVGDAVIYASPVGLIGVTPSGAEILSREQLRKEEWDAFQPSTISAWQFANTYVASRTGGGLAFATDGNMTTLDPALAASAGWYDAADGELYLVISDQVVQYDVGPSTLTATYRSRPFVLPSPTNLAVAQVRADGYPVTFRIYDYSSGTPVLKDSRNVANGEPFRLAGGYRSTAVAVEIVTAKRVTRVHLAHTFAELGQV